MLFPADARQEQSRGGCPLSTGNYLARETAKPPCAPKNTEETAHRIRSAEKLVAKKLVHKKALGQERETETESQQENK